MKDEAETMPSDGQELPGEREEKLESLPPRDDPAGDIQDPRLYKEVTDQIRKGSFAGPGMSSLFPELPQGMTFEETGPHPFSYFTNIQPKFLNAVDTAEYMRAQAEFIANQTEFVETVATAENTDVYIACMNKYSHAQAVFMMAQAKLLHELGVI
jgi:hypothetical protein